MDTSTMIRAIGKRQEMWHRFDKERAMWPTHAYLLVCEDAMLADAMLENMLLRIYCPTACESCVECKKVLSGNKIDIMQPNPKGEVLKVDAARDIVEDASMGAFEGGKKVYVIRRLDLQNERLQNALLKTLEEPNERVVFVLSAESTRGILPTVLSRVKTHILPTFSCQDAQSVLINDGISERDAASLARACGGNLTMAYNLARNEEYFSFVESALSVFTRCAKSSDICTYLLQAIFEKENIAVTLDIMARIVEDMLFVKNGQEDVTYTHLLPQYRAFVARVSQRAMPLWAEQIQDAMKKLQANCASMNVADDLLLGILEVRNLCAQS